VGAREVKRRQWLVRTAESLFQKGGFRVALDHPFNGAMVPSFFHKENRSVLALMIEVNRSLYMDEVSGERLPVLAVIK
jgi:N-formylglutamate amidohydrolase